jgi:hypothetical protein
MNAFRAATRRPLPGSPFNVPDIPRPPAETYTVSDLVTHDKYGLGTVIGVEDGAGLVVDFGSHKQRIRMPCTKLTKL